MGDAYLPETATPDVSDKLQCDEVRNDHPEETTERCAQLKPFHEKVELTIATLAEHLNNKNGLA